MHEKHWKGKNFIPAYAFIFMARSSPFPIAGEILKLENLVGRLSPVQKMLLGTDARIWW
jgi:hypothetical protein